MPHGNPVEDGPSKLGERPQVLQKRLGEALPYSRR
jgi:hypothetical protein